MKKEKQRNEKKNSAFASIHAGRDHDWLIFSTSDLTSIRSTGKLL